LAEKIDGIKSQKFGIEVEMTGLTRAKAARVLAKHFDTTAEHFGGSYDKYIVRDSQNRKWSIVYDSSIHATQSDGSSASTSYKVEFVTPICTYDDIPDIQQIVRDFREAGGVCNGSTGIHIHINAEPYDARTLRNIVNIVASKEDMIYDALQVGEGRSYYCKKTDKNFLERINREKPTSMEKFKSIWYNGCDGSHTHYHDSRYHLLNLHSVFSKGTVEFRAFNSTLHAGVIRAYLVFCLAISNQALTQKSAQCKPTHSPNQKYTFRTWLLRLGLIGDEFKNCRKHLLSHLEGNIAWKNPEQAIAQRERLKQERIAAREQACGGVSHETAEIENVPDENSEPTESECDGFEEDESFEMSM
jgi:hypothetical protein